MSVGSVWLPSCCRTGTDTPRRVKAATREGHPAPWLAGELDPKGAQSEDAPEVDLLVAVRREVDLLVAVRRELVTVAYPALPTLLSSPPSHAPALSGAG